MTEPFAGARGPRRPLDLSGLDAAVADGRRRVRRRRATAGAGLLSVSLLATLAVGFAVRDPAPTPVDPARDARPFVSVEERRGNPACCPAAPAQPYEVGDLTCSVISGPPTMVAGDPASFTYELCTDVEALVNYSGRDFESLFVHADGDRTPLAVWGDQTRRPDGETNALLVPSDGCWVWTVVWDGRDGAGRKVRPGRYVIHPILYRTATPEQRDWPSHTVEVTR